MRIGRVGWFETATGIGIAVVTEVQPEGIKVKTPEGLEQVLLKGTFHSIPDVTNLAIKVRELAKVELFLTEDEKASIAKAEAVVAALELEAGNNQNLK